MCTAFGNIETANGKNGFGHGRIRLDNGQLISFKFTDRRVIEDVSKTILSRISEKKIPNNKIMVGARVIVYLTSDGLKAKKWGIISCRPCKK